MPHATVADVLLILDTALPQAAIERFILSAHRVMDTLFDPEEEWEDGFLEELEAWLTAHLIVSTREPVAESITGAGVSVKIRQQTHGTPYSKQLSLLDTTGILSGWLSGNRVIPVVLV